MIEQILYYFGSFLVGCGVGLLVSQLLRERWLDQAITDLENWGARIKQRVTKYPGVSEEISTDVDAMTRDAYKIKRIVTKRFR